jgi:tRNA threonylcarbamoyladenosine biosynthesis protein TsaB
MKALCSFVSFVVSGIMFVLGIDTSGKSGGVTLAEAQEHGFRVLASAAIEGGTFSAQLVPTIAAILEKHRLSVRQLDGFAVTSGPGSFTGLRVGLSAVKGLAEVLNKPIVTVSLLEALASLSPQNGRVVAALDAGRGEVFYGLYEVSAGTAAKVTEQLLSMDEFLEQARKAGITLIVSSDVKVAEAASVGGSKTQLLERPDSSVVARLGARKLASGDRVPVEALDANYLRRSDAELFFKGNR